MKKLYYILLCTAFYSISLVAQSNNQEGKDKIKALKVAYFTEQLELTTKEAQEFWPLYNAYDQEQRLLRHEFKTKLKAAINKAGKIDSLSDESAENLVSLKLNIDKKKYDSQVKFSSKINKVISYKKILKLQIAEIDFGRKLMKKYKRGKK
ncbi:sensor of ECF-type sigma factor [Polaribacter sp.]|uniref:sensor of ECF-type sigma factor n=1 Tax=Polaribacter sp. TaxID=1920175 RepID=UPI003EF7F058